MSKMTTYFSVSAKSWIIGLSDTGIFVVRTTRPAAFTTRCRMWFQVG